MDKGKEKVNHNEGEFSHPRRKQRVGFRRRYPSLSEQHKFLCELRVLKTADGTSGWVGLTANDLDSSDDSSNDLEADGLSTGADPAQELDKTKPRSGGHARRPISVPGMVQGPDEAGKSKTGTFDDFQVGQEVSGIILQEIPGGYFAKIKIGYSEVGYSGVLFKPGSFDRPASVGVVANSALIGNGAINWEALSPEGHLGASIEEAITRSMKLPENVPQELVKEAIKKVHSKSLGQEPLRATAGRLHTRQAANAARREHQDLVKTVEDALTVKVAAPAKKDHTKVKPEPEW